MRAGWLVWLAWLAGVWLESLDLGFEGLGTDRQVEQVEQVEQVIWRQAERS